MTLLTHCRYLKRSNRTTNNLTTMRAIALMVFVLLFLTSVVAHADHLADQRTAVEQQNCQLCNQGIDTPSEVSQIQATVVTRYYSYTPQITTTEFPPSQFVQPPLRAPPFSQ